AVLPQDLPGVGAGARRRLGSEAGRGGSRRGPEHLPRHRLRRLRRRVLPRDRAAGPVRTEPAAVVVLYRGLGVGACRGRAPVGVRPGPRPERPQPRDAPLASGAPAAEALRTAAPGGYQTTSPQFVNYTPFSRNARVFDPQGTAHPLPGRAEVAV